MSEWVDVKESVEELLPHRAPMALLSKALRYRDDAVQAETIIDDKFKLFMDEEGCVGSWVLLEIMAQTLGIYAAKKIGNGKAPIGFLLGTRRFSTTRPVISRGERVVVFAKCVYFAESDFPSQFECKATIGDETIAEANLTTFIPKNLKEWNH